MRVAVVGAGLGGLSAACHLVGRGHDVIVLERETEPGGRAGKLEMGGFRFDTGPTVLTMPELLEETVNAAGASLDALLRLSPVEPMYRAAFADGSVIRVRHGREAMTEEIRAVCGEREAHGFERFADWLIELYRLEMGPFINRNFDSPIDLVRPIGPLLRLLRHGGLRKMAAKVSSFFSDRRLQQLFSFQSMYAGLAPYEALAVYCVITYMDSIGGVFFPRGGMHAVATALAAAAAGGGAEIRYGEAARQITLDAGDSGRATGVRLAGGEFVAADAVVCNLDLPVAYRDLLPGVTPPRRARRGRYSPSAVVWHAGVRGDLPEGTAHHNIHFGNQWEEAFRALLRDGRRMPDPSILVTVPTVDDPSMAPPGAHGLYVLEPVPNLDSPVDWERESQPARDDLQRRVAALGYPVDVEVESFVDPRDWERAGMERGTPFALAHRFFQTGPFRPANTDNRTPGVVFVGSGTVPGVGVPMVLISGRLAAQRVEELRQ